MLLDSFDSLLLDLDGVVYLGQDPVVHAVEAVNRAQLATKVGYVTNNSSRTPDAIAKQLRAFGIATSPEQIVGSARAGARLLAQRIPAGSKVLVVGGEGLRFECESLGFKLVTSSADKPVAVIQGFSPDVSWRDLAQASFAIQNGAVWIATNQDWTIPLEAGIAPGNGTLVGAVHTAVGILPDFAGKPFRPIFEQAMTQLEIKKPLMVGDRIDTDIRGAKAFGISSAVVMTGIASRKELIGAKPEDRPDFILNDLRGLFEKYPKLKKTKRGVSCNQSEVEKLGDKIVLISGDPGSLDSLRAATELIWNCKVPIYALQVEAALYQEAKSDN
jgi:HAD superfamily hydrolase (TIGR01450 family)